MVMTDVNATNLTHAEIDLPKNKRPPAIPNEKMHDSLLEYLLARLNQDRQNKSSRTTRFARIDKDVSTWLALSKEDQKRQAKKDSTGESQAIAINLPIQHTHIDDLVSFFSGIYAPNSGSFYEEPNDSADDRKERTDAIKKMNADAKKNKYFKNLCKALRALMKYNVGGFAVEWQPTDTDSPSDGTNTIRALDMYNTMWDPAIDDPSEIPTKAEWAAEARRENRMVLIKGEQAGFYYGTGHILSALELGFSNGNIATYYSYPPNHAGLATDGSNGAQATGARADWGAYGVGLPGESGSVPLEHTHEVVDIYCWLNPTQFRLRFDQADPPKNTYVLYKATILDAQRIIALELVALDDENPQPDNPPRIPYFIGYLNQDDMGIAQRSIAELLAPFQNYGSFLLNADVAASRGAIYGIQGYDPEMFDLKSIEPGTTVARIPSKKPGVDVRTGLMTLQGNTNNGQAMDSLAKLMALIDKFFPGQALPSQIAGIDRAVQSQVAAVMQGVNRRLHMLVRILDDDILGPTRHEQVMNMIRSGNGSFTGMTESDIMKMIGSGLAQLNRETAAQAMQQILFAIIQNPKSMEQYDVIGIMNFWSQMLNVDADLERFRIAPQQPAAQAPGAAPQIPPGAVPPAMA